MKAEALSIVHPAGTRIAEGKKTLEIRSWLPPRLPLLNLLIVENRRRLDRDGDTDADGLGVAWIDILHVRPWTDEDAQRDGHRCAQPGYHAWEISNLRPITEPFRVQAERGIYQVEVDVRPPFQLRQATEADLPFLEELRRITLRDTLTNHYPWDEAAQRERVLLNFECAKIILRQDRKVGLWKIVHHPDHIHLSQVQLRPDCQGLGIGTSLITALQMESARLGLPIKLRVFQSNKAICLYSRLGFEISANDTHAFEMSWRPKAKS